MTQVSYTVNTLQMADIYSDDEFNCRGSIAPIDVADLAKSIQSNGLQFPISVQPASDVSGVLPAGKRYRIVAGHRRFKACLVLGMKEIPAFVREGLTEVAARILNLSENFDRKDLNLLQEAKALDALHKAGLPRDTVARELNKSSGWVQVRYNLLSLPEEIQQEAAAGILNQYQIKQLYTLDTPEEMFDAVRKLKEAKVRGEKVEHIGKRKKNSTSSKKSRTRPELFDMMELMAKSVGYGLHTRVIAWATGEITTDEMFDDIAAAADEAGKEFLRPREF